MGLHQSHFAPESLKMDWSRYGVWCGSFHPCTLIRTSKQSRAFQKKVAMVTGHFRRGLATFPHFAGCLNHFHQPSIIYPMESTSLGKTASVGAKKKGLDVPRNQPVTKTKIDSNSAYSIKDLYCHTGCFLTGIVASSGPTSQGKSECAITLLYQPAHRIDMLKLDLLDSLGCIVLPANYGCSRKISLQPNFVFIG